ncbi:nucleotide sugar dehydrogenase [Albidovulum sediminicola]|uniref:UDP-glucose 6-dehydrogenase n=1 Tax=Albidovulum sediminicola TaxID=2984331 RepID=A0ABT2Z1L6_9RHOB|nr:nucleotide sugar dehydrogenase [Defluviimonas sp. WL0075]MCV2864996.1 nucleotide sugar dehydrogenase [Defluviimonas sp. WL0075]
MKIAVVGLGHVGLANAVLLAQRHEVWGVDIDPRRVATLNARQSPTGDPELADHLANRPLDLRATTDLEAAARGADYVLIATPTDYNPVSNAFDTSSVDTVCRDVLAMAPKALVVIRSTVPLGHVRALRQRLGSDRILFSPEFLREGRALHDNLHPSRIVVGERSDRASRFADLLREASADRAAPVLLVDPDEAEAVKLFSNTYLAMRVAFFNELDSYALSHGLDASRIVAGVSGDPRIGDHYNNPSFGYGGYCLPKDTRQLLANYEEVPQKLIGAVVEANRMRKDFIAQAILERRPRVVGIYRIVMKEGSDNWRQSATAGIVRRLMDRGVGVIVHEPTFSGVSFLGAPVVATLAEFKARADVIVANRFHADLADVADRVFTRDLAAQTVRPG